MLTEKTWYWFGVGLLTLTAANNFINKPLIWPRWQVENVQNRFEELSAELPEEAMGRLQARRAEPDGFRGSQFARLQIRLAQMQSALNRRQAQFARMQAHRVCRAGGRSSMHQQIPLFGATLQ